MRYVAVILVSAMLMSVISYAQALPLPSNNKLQLWLRADAGVEQLDGRVTLWRDQSGKGNDARAAPETAPVWALQGVREKPSVQFDGSHSCLCVAHNAGLNGADGLTTFCVFRYLDGFRIAQKKNNSKGLVRDAWFLTPQSGLGAGGQLPKNPYFRTAHAYLQASVYDPRAATIRVYSNGELASELTNVPSCEPNEDPIYVGKRQNPGDTEGHLRGDLAELILYNAPLSDEERQAVEAYLREKYGILQYGQESLPLTRVIPGDRQVTAVWQKPETAVPDEDISYRIETKLRTSPWEQALRQEVDGAQRSGAVSGLLNHADYMLRVFAVRRGTGEVVARSAERLFAPGCVPGVVIDYIHKDETFYLNKGIYIGSPSLARLPDGRLVASHDLFGCGSWDFSRIFRSDDNGSSWYHVADLAPAFWGKLFVHRGKLYLIAAKGRSNDLVLYHSPDGGAAWTGPVVLASGRYHKAPVPVIEHRGRLWTCVEFANPDCQAVTASAPADADLMDPRNWLLSEPLKYDPAWQPKGWNPKRASYIEGNAVVAPQGGLLNILRLNVAPYHGKVVALNIAPDGRSLSFNRLLDFNGGHTKFTILRHPETGIYWSLVNRLPEPRDGRWALRNVLTLVRSRDLDHWEPMCDVLRDDREFASRCTGFQYVDWLFDGEDIIFVCRMGYNGAHNFHDANYLTFHRIESFARLPVEYGP